ncbi:MAG: bifunctional UDP-N-acetylglucosamine diphosphorylase/glucosamine-1-phosphate N-acetyltransferase GlmU [Candidatus Melainabacteria bacterium]
MSPLSAPQTAPLHAIVMAAGKGTRLKSDTPKVLHDLFGKPLLVRVLETLTTVHAHHPLLAAHVIVGHGRGQVQAVLAASAFPMPVSTVVQEPQLGTGHAVLQVKQAVPDLAGSVLILSGDVPLLRAETVLDLVSAHHRQHSDLTLLTTDLSNPTGYGRVLCDAEGNVQRVVEERDATVTEKAVPTVNTGVYCLNWPTIAPLLDDLTADNAQGELYLTDVIGLAVKKGLTVRTVTLHDPSEVLGVNHRLDLSLCHEVAHQWAMARLMDGGVTILSPATTLIAPEVTVGRDTVIYPGCVLLGDVTVGEGCVIGPHTTLKGEVTIGDGSQVTQSVVSDSRVAAGSSIGPFAHLRDGAAIGSSVKIGNFVEVKNTTVADQSFASHLAYVGDATVGRNVNLGAGCITANFDPIRGTKHHTVIEDGVKVGCNAVLVAPLTVARDACVAAGSVITEDVASGDLAIARPRQSAIAGWVKKVRDALVP